METLTLAKAKTLTGGERLTHKTERDSRGELKTVKVNGKAKTWKTRPDAVRVPAKYGLYQYFQIGQGDTDQTIDSHLSDWQI